MTTVQRQLKIEVGVMLGRIIQINNNFINYGQQYFKIYKMKCTIKYCSTKVFDVESMTNEGKELENYTTYKRLSHVDRVGNLSVIIHEYTSYHWSIICSWIVIITLDTVDIRWIWNTRAEELR